MPAERLTIAIFNQSRSWSLPSVFVDRIAAAAGPDVETRSARSRSELLDLLPETTYLVGLPPGDEAIMQRGPRLKWIQLTGSLGDTELALLPALRAGVRISTAASIRAPQVAEHAICLALALTRRLDIACAQMAERNWAPQLIGPRLRTLRSATLGLIAEHSVRLEVATRAKALGMHVLAAMREPRETPGVIDEAMPQGQLPELLSRSDVVIVAAPRTPSTAGLLNKTQIGRMRREAILVNVSRAGVVHEAALLDALVRQRIGGAGIDVFDSEPLSPNSPFWSLPNVIITPHVAAASPTYWDDATRLICENVKRLKSHMPLIDEAPEEWYAPATIS